MKVEAFLVSGWLFVSSLLYKLGVPHSLVSFTIPLSSETCCILGLWLVPGRPAEEHPRLRCLRGDLRPALSPEMHRQVEFLTCYQKVPFVSILQRDLIKAGQVAVKMT